MKTIGLPNGQASALVVKRLLDVTGALALLVLCLPLMLVIATAIKLESRGPVLYRQRRLGFRMREFTMLKFRTMRPNEFEDVHQRYIESLLTDAAPPAPARATDFRAERSRHVTFVGSLLRASSLDELPQLFNVIAGQMSLVGPRPCMPYEPSLFEPHHFARFEVRAGITGLWQVAGGEASTWREALEVDVSYARDWSLADDMRILLATPWRVLQGNKGL
jgi:lipopolysaccharide/colanic/teichoic acid biosynthesis glycosyltransferase